MVIMLSAFGSNVLRASITVPEGLSFTLGSREGTLRLPIRNESDEELTIGVSITSAKLQLPGDVRVVTIAPRGSVDIVVDVTIDDDFEGTEIENTAVSALPSLSEADRADMEAFLDDLLAASAPRYEAVRSDYERVLRQRVAHPLSMTPPARIAEAVSA